MILFIRNIPGNCHLSDLHEFVAPVLKRSFPFRSGSILKSEILVIRDKHTNALEYHGLVYVDAEAAGQRAIKKLKGKRLKNKLVMVREFYHRSWHNDRRLIHKHLPDDIINKRIGDRRRGGKVEMIKDISCIFSANAEAARKFI